MCLSLCTGERCLVKREGSPAGIVALFAASMAVMFTAALYHTFWIRGATGCLSHWMQSTIQKSALYLWIDSGRATRAPDFQTNEEIAHESYVHLCVLIFPTHFRFSYMYMFNFSQLHIFCMDSCGQLWVRLENASLHAPWFFEIQKWASYRPIIWFWLCKYIRMWYSSVLLKISHFTIRQSLLINLYRYYFNTRSKERPHLDWELSACILSNLCKTTLFWFLEFY